MKLKIFTLRLNPATGIFDEGELASFQLGKDVIEITEHFLVHEKTPTLLLVLRYRDVPDNGGGTRQPQKIKVGKERAGTGLMFPTDSTV